jgi:hypothetical protein
VAKKRYFLHCCAFSSRGQKDARLQGRDAIGADGWSHREEVLLGLSATGCEVDDASVFTKASGSVPWRSRAPSDLWSRLCYLAVLMR